MGFSHHRKLLTDCTSWCDPLNSSGICFISCLDVCQTICRYPFPVIPPPEYPVPNDSGSPPPGKPNYISPLLITTFVALSLTILLIGAYVVFFRYFRGRGSRGRSVVQSQRAAPPPDGEEFLDQGPFLDHPIWYIRTVGLQPSAISKITVCKYKRGDGLVEGTECSVCLTEFEEDETVRLLPKCSHAFHVSCIDTWLLSHTNCPNCRALIVTNVDRSPSPEPSTNSSVSWEVIALDESSDDGPSSEVENISQTLVETEVEAEEESEDTSRNEHVTEEEVKSNMQPMRRSVSVDSLSATKISLAIADFLAGRSVMRRSESNSGLGDADNRIEQDTAIGVVPKMKLVEEEQRGMSRFMDNAGSSIGSSSSRKRSLSLSGRFFLSKYSLSRSSVLPL